MMGSTLALTTRSLREDWRGLRNHLMRLLFVGLIVLMLVQAQQTSVWFGAPGLRFFGSIAWVNFWFILLAAPGYFASAITEEKEEQTLGLLRMADVGSAAIVLGKSVPRLLGAALLLSAQFPFTLLAVTLGGVTIGQVQAAYCTLLAFLLFSGTLGVFWSVVCRRSNGAAWMTSISLGAILLVPWWIGLVAGAAGGVWTGVADAAAWLSEASAAIRLNAIMQTGFTGSPVGYQVLTNLAAAAVLLGFSWAVFGPCNRDERDEAPARGLLIRRNSRLRALGAGRAWETTILPFVWKDFHFIAGGRTMILLKLVLYGPLGLLVAFAYDLTWPGRAWDAESIGGTLMTVSLCVLAIEAALCASRVFREEAKWNTLSSLLMLPPSTAAIAYAKVSGCLLSLVPATVWLLVGALIWPKGFFDVLSELLKFRGDSWFLTHGVLLLHLIAWLSLLVRWGAIPLALVAVLLLTGCWISVFELTGMGPRGPRDDHAFFYVLILMALFASGLLHVLIGRRLRALAGE
jgi:hypothetical protein